MVDIHQHDPNLNNYDHHQFARDASHLVVSLVLQKFGLYEDTKDSTNLETTEWFDCRGPNDTADWLGLTGKRWQIKLTPRFHHVSGICEKRRASTR